MEAPTFFTAAHGSPKGETVVWRSETAKHFHHRMGYAIRQAKPHGATTSFWKEGRALMGRLAQWSKVLDVQLAGEEPFSTFEKFCTPQLGSISNLPGDDVSEEATTASGQDDDAVSTLASAARRPRVRLHRRANKKKRKLQGAESVRILAKGQKQLSWLRN